MHEDLVDRLAAGDPSALARCISLMERGSAAADLIHRRICPRVGRATVIGFTGAPGAGKSTLIDAYIAALERRMRRLIAERAGRIVRDLVRNADSADLAHLVEAAASGEIGIDAAARRALKAVL
jgi:predicted ATPase